MNNQISNHSSKLPFFYRNLPIILGVIIIIMVVGRAFAWQYFRAPPEEEVKVSEEVIFLEGENRAEKAKIQEKIIVATDKDSYERLGSVIFTIKNNTDRKIFSTWQGASTGFDVTFEKYNKEMEEWEIIRNFFFRPKPFLYPGESIQFEVNLYEREIRSDAQKKLRIAVEYLDHEKCKYPDYIKNKEIRRFCFEQKKTVYSNEFIVKGPIAEALKFCYERKKQQDSFLRDIHYIVGPTFYFNFDKDQDKEIIGLCNPDGWGGYMVLFVLDKKNGEYKSVLVKEKEIQAQRYYKFANLKIVDVDQDGIDEIIFEEAGWFGGGGFSYLHLYSPKYDEWFWRQNSWHINIDTMEKEEKISFPLNLEEYKVFKNFLSK